MKRLFNLLKVVIFVTIPLLGSGCNQTRKLPPNSKPSDRIIGHWVEKETNTYIGKIDLITNTGPYSWVEYNGRTVEHQYQIIKENPSGEMIHINLFLKSGDTREQIHTIPKNGLSMKIETDVAGWKVKNKKRYVDGRTNP